MLKHNFCYRVTFGQVQTVTVLSTYGIAWIMGCLVEASYLLRIVMFLRMAYGLEHLFNAIPGEDSDRAQDGPNGAKRNRTEQN